MTDERILDKLAKLLELAERGDDNEAAVAAQRAAELMAKHQIDSAEIASRGSPSAPVIEEGRVDASPDDIDLSRVEDWHKMLVAVVAESCGARAYVRGRGKLYKFFAVGPRGSVDATRYMYTMLARDVGRRARQAARERYETNAWRRAYARGMVVRVRERLEAGRRAIFSGATSQALVVVDRTKIAIDARFEGMRQIRSGAKKRPDGSAYGYEDGDSVDLGSADARQLAEGQRRLK